MIWGLHEWSVQMCDKSRSFFQWSNHCLISWPSFQYYEKNINIIASSVLHVTLTGPWMTGSHAAVLSLTVISPRGWWWADKQFTWAKNEAENWWDKHYMALLTVKKRLTGKRGKDEKMLLIVTDWLRSEVGWMLGTCDNVHQRWCNTLLAREIPFLPYFRRHVYCLRF